MKNITGYDKFKTSRLNKINENSEEVVNEEVEEVINEEVEEVLNEETEEEINEGAQLFNNSWRVRSRVEVPMTLISAYKKKVQTETGEDVGTKMGEEELAEELVRFVTTSYLNIENLPVSIVSSAEVQPTVQVQEEMPDDAQVQAQVQAQAQVQPQAQDTQIEVEVESEGKSQTQSQAQISQTEDDNEI